MAEKERPTGVTVLAILGFIFGGLAILSGLVMSAIGASMVAQGWQYMGGGLLGAGMLVYGIVAIVISWALWTGKTWGWWLEVIFSAIGVLSILTGNIVGAVISAVILWYFFKPEVKDYFGVKVEFST